MDDDSGAKATLEGFLSRIEDLSSEMADYGYSPVPVMVQLDEAAERLAGIIATEYGDSLEAAD